MAPQPTMPNKRPLSELPDYLREHGFRVTGVAWPTRMGEGVEFDFEKVDAGNASLVEREELNHVPPVRNAE